MHFLSFVYRNVTRRKLRSLLTASAVAIAVASVVALVGIASGFQATFLEFYEGVGIDLLVVRTGSARRLTSTIDQSLVPKIEAVKGVTEVIPGLADVVSFPDEGLYVVAVSGLVPETMVFDHMEMIGGRKLTKEDGKACMLGATLADTLGKKTGDKVEIVEGDEFVIIGVFDGFSVIENGSIVVSVGQLQRLMDRDGQVSGISVIVDEPSNEAELERIAAEIKTMEQGISVRQTKEHVESLSEIQVAIAMAWLTSVVAMIIGTLGMLNTMLMSLQERIGEIGLLRAVGWTRSRIAKMILAESILMSVIGGLMGVVAAFILVAILTELPVAKGLIEGRIDLKVIGQGMLIAVIVGVLGGVLPALNATRLAPADALRQ